MRTAYPLSALALALATAATAPAVIIDSGDGTGNTTAPSPDPGWAHVGSRGGLTAVYLQDGWVLTANHVGAGDVVLDGVTYSRVPGNEHRLGNGDGTFADLLMFAISPHPPLAPLAISSSAPQNGASLILIGNGRNRGDATSWDPDPGPPPSQIDGYLWGPGAAKRWGTNFVENFPVARIFGTEAFGSVFDEADSAHEAQVATGDSGGAAFAWTGSAWELAGILFARGVFQDQPDETALYGNQSYAANLSFYRNEILDVIEMPEPRSALWPAAALLAALARVRRVRRADRRSRQRIDSLSATAGLPVGPSALRGVALTALCGRSPFPSAIPSANRRARCIDAARCCCSPVVRASPGVDRRRPRRSSTSTASSSRSTTSASGC